MLSRCAHLLKRKALKLSSKGRVAPNQLECSRKLSSDGLSTLPYDVLRLICQYFDDLHDYVFLSRTSAALRSFFDAEPTFWQRACTAAGYGIPSAFTTIDSWQMLAGVICMRMTRARITQVAIHGSTQGMPFAIPVLSQDIVSENRNHCSVLLTYVDLFRSSSTSTRVSAYNIVYRLLLSEEHPLQQHVVVKSGDLARRPAPSLAHLGPNPAFRLVVGVPMEKYDGDMTEPPATELWMTNTHGVTLHDLNRKCLDIIGKHSRSESAISNALTAAIGMWPDAYRYRTKPNRLFH